MEVSRFFSLFNAKVPLSARRPKCVSGRRRRPRRSSHRTGSKGRCGRCGSLDAAGVAAEAAGPEELAIRRGSKAAAEVRRQRFTLLLIDEAPQGEGIGFIANMPISDPGELPEAGTAADGDVAMTERRYTEAAKLFGEAANYVPSGHASERGGYLLHQANALYRQGDERGDNDALKSSIEVYGRALAEYPRSEAPLDWAMTQNNLGNALKVLGERESGTASLEAAVQAFRAALEEWTRERVPLAWAATTGNRQGRRPVQTPGARAGAPGIDGVTAAD
jgi:tetratricopeptide (TPR) repeat protein